MNWLPNDSSKLPRSAGVYPRKIWKIRTLEMQFPAIWSKHWKLCRIPEFDFFSPLLTKANRGAHSCAPPSL
jgi:hypothetical protein